MTLLEIADTLNRKLARLRFGPPVSHVYNPVIYARDAHAEYLRRFGRGRRDVLLIGMNPGPWGMVQTGVPFGEIAIARDWLKIRAEIGRPRREHPKRPVLGWDCPRSEVSGARLWGWARDQFGTPEKFFRRFYVANYCPLAFMLETGANLTPDKLPGTARDRLLAACDAALRQTVDCLKPKHVIGIGVFAQRSAERALDGMGLSIGRILHPSPASPAANRGWAQRATADLVDQGIRVP